MRVLVAEDEPALAGIVAHGLRKAGMAVDVVHAGDVALAQLEINSYDVVVLDRDLPSVHGDEVCRALVARGMPVRILMLTAAAATADLVRGLALGADDYLGKPFEFDELVARVRALSRRAVRPVPPVLRHGSVELDVARHQASRDGRFLSLSVKEFGVLHELMSAPGAVVSAETLLERVWDENTDPFTNAVRITISRLRAKLGPPPVVETVPGVGYRVSTDSPAAVPRDGG